MPAQWTGGIADAVAALTGGRGIEQSAYHRALRERAALDHAVAQAALAGNEVQGQAGWAAAQTDPMLRDAVLGKLAGQINSMASAERTQARTGFDASAVEAALAGNYDAANAYKFGTTNAPVALTSNVGNLLFNPVATTGAQPPPVVAPIGEALIAKENLNAEAARALIGEREARTNLIDRTDPNIRRTRGAAGSTADGLTPAQVRLQRAQEYKEIVQAYGEKSPEARRWLAMNPSSPGAPGASDRFIDDGVNLVRSLMTPTTPSGTQKRKNGGGKRATAAAALAPAVTLDEFMAKARAVNPGVPDAELKAYYDQNYGAP